MGISINDFGKRILIVDGAMGTMIQAKKPDFRGAPEILNKEDTLSIGF